MDVNENIKSAIITSLLVVETHKDEVEKLKKKIIGRFERLGEYERILFMVDELDKIAKIVGATVIVRNSNNEFSVEHIYYPFISILLGIVKKYGVEYEIDFDGKILSRSPVPVDVVKSILDEFFDINMLRRIAVNFAMENPSDYIQMKAIEYSNLFTVLVSGKYNEIIPGDILKKFLK